MINTERLLPIAHFIPGSRSGRQYLAEFEREGIGVSPKAKALLAHLAAAPGVRPIALYLEPLWQIINKVESLPMEQLTETLSKLGLGLCSCDSAPALLLTKTKLPPKPIVFASLPLHGMEADIEDTQSLFVAPHVPERGHLLSSYGLGRDVTILPEVFIAFTKKH